jgi:hypothetical protein
MTPLNRGIVVVNPLKPYLCQVISFKVFILLEFGNVKRALKNFSGGITNRGL